ncbi:hypothetical protein LPE01_23350 [Lactiplantibacillus pentosus]|nr:hypothetical protein LPE01_23350 [Lactiplantibacillus pentosus]
MLKIANTITIAMTINLTPLSYLLVALYCISPVEPIIFIAVASEMNTLRFGKRLQ